VEGRLAVLVARIRDEDVELAEMPDGLLYHVVAERGIDEIAGDHQAFPAHRVDCSASVQN